MHIIRYTPDRQNEWDAFVKMSKNGTFLFLRAYMDYHSDRFTDHSLLYYNDKGKLVALMPANERDGVLHSHQGLTYGGMILPMKSHISDVGQLFAATEEYLRQHSIHQWRYKQMPTVYHRLPAEEDTYWLWRMNAQMVACNMMSAVDLTSDTDTISSRKRTYFSKLQRAGYEVRIADDIADFWQILTDNLMERFQSQPVHSLEEIQMLQGRFPENIVCCAVRNPEGTMVAGTLLFITDRVVRTQYISASHEGKRCNALDYLMLSLLQHFRAQQTYHYFEYGTSMDEDGINLNTGLILQKEGLGGSTIACREYCCEIK